MVHTFSDEHATRYGVNEAILIEFFKFWINKNKEAGRNFHDGKTWTYNTYECIKKSFDYFSVKQVRTTVVSLIKQGVLIRGEYNRNKYDHTSWYAFVDESLLTRINNRKQNPYQPCEEYYKPDPGYQESLNFSPTQMGTPNEKLNTPSAQINHSTAAQIGRSLTVTGNTVKIQEEEEKKEKPPTPIKKIKEEKKDEGCAAPAGGGGLVQRRKRLVEIVRQFCNCNPAKYPQGLYNDFIGYWTQPNIDMTRMKFESSEYFGVRWKLASFWRQCSQDEKRGYWDEHLMRYRQPVQPAYS